MQTEERFSLAEEQKAESALATNSKMREYVSLNLNKDFRRAYYRGKSVASPAVAVYIIKNRTKTCRLGITTGKKIGCAVKRNRARRVIRAAFDELFKSEQLKNRLYGYDVVIVARTKATVCKSTQIKEQLSDIFGKSGILK